MLNKFWKKIMDEKFEKKNWKFYMVLGVGKILNFHVKRMLVQNRPFLIRT